MFVGAVVCAWMGLRSGTRLGWSFPVRPSPQGPRRLGVDSVELSGAPQSLRAPMLRALGWEDGKHWGLLEPYRAARRLREDFPCLRTARVRRAWRARSARFEVELREPAAEIVRSGRRGEYVDDQGRLFQVPEGVYASSGLPAVEFESAPPQAELRAVVRLFQASARPQILPARIVRMRRAAEGDGWVATAADGATFLWGELEWTDEKLGRLREVYGDVFSRFGALASADLRHFSEGKIFVKPRAVLSGT